MTDIKTLEQTATQVRRDILRMVHGAKSGHPGGSLGCADFLTALYFNVMNHNPKFKMYFSFQTDTFRHCFTAYWPVRVIFRLAS
jgi:transketolase N-terminal domain/subunit